MGAGPEGLAEQRGARGTAAGEDSALAALEQLLHEIGLQRARERVAPLGPVEDQQADRAAVLHDEPGVEAHDVTVGRRQRMTSP